MLRIAALALLATPLAPVGAQAQFFWDQPRFSPDDAAQVALQHGFRLIRRPVRNDEVYVADVLDRRGARLQLIISADSGQILQRVYVEAGRDYRPRFDPTIPPGPIPPGRIPQGERRPGFFARLFGGGDDADVPMPDGAPPIDRPMIGPDQPVRQPRVRRQPRIVEQAPETVRQTPVESEPLAPPSSAPLLPPRAATPRNLAPRPPVQASLPPPAAANPPPAAPAPVTSPAPTGPARSISRNPLAIPGSREQDEKAAAAQPARPTGKDAPAAKPATPVPVAPLE